MARLRLIGLLRDIIKVAKMDCGPEVHEATDSTASRSGTRRSTRYKPSPTPYAAARGSQRWRRNPYAMTRVQRRERYDVVVCGGGAAGVGAAVAAARCGARVALLEQAPFHGGAVTRSGVLARAGLVVRRCDPRAARPRARVPHRDRPGDRHARVAPRGRARAAARP